MQMKTICMKVHILIGRREKHGHSDIERKQIVTRRLDFVPCGITIRARDREMPSNCGFFADEHTAVTPGESAVVRQRTLKLNPAASDFLHFDTIQKTPAWLSPYRGGCGYENQREIRTTISLSESETAKLTLNRKKFFCIRQPLLSIRPNASFQKLTLGLAISGGQDRKKTPPVYRCGWVLRGYTRTLNERTPPTLQPVMEVA